MPKDIESLSNEELLKMHFLSDAPDDVLLETEAEIIRRWAGRLPVIFVTLPDFSNQKG